MGRKPLLQLSVSGSLISLACVGIGLNTGAVTLASIAIVAFIMCALHFPSPVLSGLVTSGQYACINDDV
jgi:hypothetical protein